MIGSGVMHPREYTPSLSLCGSFGRACVHEMLVLGRVTERTVRMAPGRAEASHVPDSMRQKALLVRALEKLRRVPVMERPVAQFVLKCPTFHKTPGLRVHLEKVLARAVRLDVERVRLHVARF